MYIMPVISLFVSYVHIGWSCN